mgnify:CR=1 FL=1
MKLNNIGYLLKEGFRGIFLHGFMSFAAIVVTVACLLIVGSFSILVYNVNIMVEELDRSNEVLVYIDEEFTDAQARSVGTQINQIENVFQADFVTRETALKNFVEDHDNDPAFNGVQAEDLRHRYVVKLTDNTLMEQTVAELEAIEGVANINAPYELAKGFATVRNVLQLVSVVIMLVLLAVSLLIISNTVKLSMYDRRDEIAIMKMVGATNTFIRMPFVVEGTIIGFLSGVVSYYAQMGVYRYITDKLIAGVSFINIVPFETFSGTVFMLVTLAGIAIGLIGSVFTIQKFMKV